MSYENVRIVVDTYLADNFGTSYKFVPENFNFIPAAGTTWVRYSLRPVNSQSGDVSATLLRREWLLWFQIFIPESEGSVDATKIGDLIAGLFDEQRIALDGFGLLTFRRAELAFIGEDASGVQMWRCTVPFKEEEPSQSQP